MDLVSRVWSHIVARADALNFASAFLIFIIGFTLWVLRVRPIRSSRAVRNALEFWILQWLLLLIVYALRMVHGGIPSWVQIALVDVQSLLLVGFSFTYMTGDRHRISDLIRNLTFIAVVLLPIEWLLGLGVERTAVGSIWRYGAIAPSVLLSLVALFFLAVAFLLRYGWFALPMSMASICYAFLQWPIYSSVVVQLAPDRRLFLLLALGKLILGGFFYIYFFAPLPRYDAIALPALPHETRGAIQARLLESGKAALALLITIITGIFCSLVWEVFRERLGR